MEEEELLRLRLRFDFLTIKSCVIVVRTHSKKWKQILNSWMRKKRVARCKLRRRLAHELLIKRSSKWNLNFENCTWSLHILHRSANRAIFNSTFRAWWESQFGGFLHKLWRKIVVARKEFHMKEKELQLSRKSSDLPVSTRLPFIFGYYDKFSPWGVRMFRGSKH